MQSSHNPLFERFGVFSTVMPYFDTTHKSFYFLSQFNSQSRAMLDKYYEGFLNVMIGNLAILEIEENENIIKLPWDLFRYKIYLSWESRVEIFIELIESINNENGWYFNKHLMNTRFWVDRIWINEKFVKQLYPYLDLLKKTEVTDCIVKLNLKIINFN